MRHAPTSPEPAVAELSLAIGQLVRRLRTEANPDELTWSQLAVLGRLDKTGPMGTTLADLEQAKLVQRRPHPTDGRQVLFELTIDGTEARRQRTVAKREWLLAAMTKLDPAEQQTLIIAAALIKRLAES
jgi:hypothetical protein